MSSIHVSPITLVKALGEPQTAVQRDESIQRLLETMEARSEENAALRVSVQRLRTQLRYAESRLSQHRTHETVHQICGFVLGAITAAAVWWIGSVVQ